LIDALKSYKGGVISISHDERFITNTSNQVSHVLRVWLTPQLWVCHSGRLDLFKGGDVQSYKKIIVEQLAVKKTP
jgi:ATP-binding cassette subfamily F protein 3